MEYMEVFTKVCGDSLLRVQCGNCWMFRKDYGIVLFMMYANNFFTLKWLTWMRSLKLKFSISLAGVSCILRTLELNCEYAKFNGNGDTIIGPVGNASSVVVGCCSYWDAII